MTDHAEPSPTGILARLIAFPTISRRPNLELLDYLESLLKPAGVRVDHPRRTREGLHGLFGGFGEIARRPRKSIVDRAQIGGRRADEFVEPGVRHGEPV